MVSIANDSVECKACEGSGLVTIAPVPVGGKLGGKTVCQECSGTGVAGEFLMKPKIVVEDVGVADVKT